MKQQKLYVCYSINDFYAREAGISLLGFLDNNPDYEPEEVFFIDYGIHPANRERLNSITALYGRRITYLDGKPVTDRVKRHFPNYPAWKGSMAACIKPFIDEVIPDYVQRLLYIDADTVVVGSVSELKAMDMGEAVVAGTISNTECHRLRRKEYELYSGNLIYMGTGVLLYDLSNWRRENCREMMYDVLRKKKRIRLPDQTLLNNAIPERLMKVLPTKYNYVTHTYHPWQEYHWLRQYRIYSKQECREAIRHPVIIHYLTGIGMCRPWHEGCLSHRKEAYYHYKALSPWKDSPLFPNQIELYPPKGFYQKLDFWFIRTLSMPIPFFLAWLLYKVYCGVYFASGFIITGEPDLPSEGKEAIDNEK